MTINEFMKKTGVTNRRYVLQWLAEGLIPGAVQHGDGTWTLPPSARRPFRPRCRPGADAPALWASMLRACQQRRHITAASYSMSPGEFDAIIRLLVQAGLVTLRQEDGITYYDATEKTMACRHQSHGQLKKFAVLCLEKACTSLAYGAAKAALEHQFI